MAASNQLTEMLYTTKNKQMQWHFDSSHYPEGCIPIHNQTYRDLHSRVGHLVKSFGATKPPHTLKLGMELVPETSENLHILMQLSAWKKFHWILSQQKLQDLYNTQFFTKVKWQFTFNYTTEGQHFMCNEVA
jgi:hypothetical protein